MGRESRARDQRHALAFRHTVINRHVRAARLAATIARLALFGVPILLGFVVGFGVCWFLFA